MYQHILIATDGSDLSQKSIEHGLGLSRAKECKVTIITVTKPHSESQSFDLYARPVVFGQEDIDNLRSNELTNERSNDDDLASHILSRAQSSADEAGVTVSTIHRIGDSPAVVITDTSNDLGCDLIIMGSHGRSGIKKLILGSQAEKTLQLSTIPVLVVK